ncbi:MAG TPA: hypothetical protein VM099_01180 [Gemmatimonadaceae bacterium]|nr:hypothetical protein [Gemmatimonadaceae bacterium]
MTSPRNRRLTEEEVAFIIRRATELEASESSRVGDNPASTLTLDQVEQIAADSHIDPRMVQRGAAELAAVFREPMGMVVQCRHRA